MQIHGPRTAGVHWQIAKGGGFHYHEAEARGSALPLTVFLGGPPALILAAVAPLPEGLSELLVASLLLGRKLPMTSVPSHPHRLVADAEFALVGFVPPKVRKPEGPFGDHYGYYSLAHDYPVFEVARIYRRHNAIFPATVVGKPRQEDFYIGDLLQELLSPMFPLVMPTVVDLWSYGDTGFHSLAAAVVKDRYGREAMTSAFRILGEGQLALTKFLLVTDAKRDLRDFRNVQPRSTPARLALAGEPSGGHSSGVRADAVRSQLINDLDKFVEQYDREGHPYYATARLWDDGILDPVDTRMALALGLSAAMNQPIGPTRFGVFRM